MSHVFGPNRVDMVAPAAGRLEASSAMCTHRVRLSDPTELDAQVVGWLREAYDRA